MGKVIVTEYLTLDGIFEDPGKWSFDFWSEEAAKYKYEELFASDTQLFGRVTYEGFAKAWPTMEGTGDFGVRMNTMPKYVVSQSLKITEWENSHIIKENLQGKIQAIKEKDTVLVAGSGQLVHFLLEKHLIDELHILLHPLVLGKGKRLFSTPLSSSNFTRTKSIKLPKGLMALEYHYQQ